MPAGSPSAPPIVCDDHGDIAIYAGVLQAADDVEAVDVRNGEYEFFDSHGARLTATVDGETVAIVRPPDAREEPGELEHRLRAFINRVGPERVGLADPSSARLDELVHALDAFLNP
jgi:hypothetical protein